MKCETVTRSLPALLALAACAPAVEDQSPVSGRTASSQAAAPIVLTWQAPAGGAFHAMGVEGQLVQDGSCLFLATPAHRFLLVWPEGTTWDAAARRLRFGTQSLALGTRVALSGDSREGAESVAPGYDARGCDASRVFRVSPWLARQSG